MIIIDEKISIRPRIVSTLIKGLKLIVPAETIQGNTVCVYNKAVCI